MRVLHVIPSISTRQGGPSAAIFPMVKALRRRGVGAEIATTSESRDKITSLPLKDDRPIHFFSHRRSVFRSFDDYTFSPEFTGWLNAHLQNYDLLHVHALFSHLSTSSMRSARRGGLPYISRPLGQLGRWPLSQSRLRKKLYLQCIEAKNLRGAAALHFTSPVEQEEAADLMLPSEAHVIPHGIDLPPLLPNAPEHLRFQLGLASDQKLALFLGRIHVKKGIDLLMRALAGLASPAPILLIAGEGPARPELERLALNLGFDRNVRWLGHLEGTRKDLVLQGSDLFALTSHHENFGVAVLEALAAGTTVLVSDQVGLAREIESAGMGKVVPLRVEAIRHGIAACLQSAAPGDGARRRAFAARYSWEENAAALEKLYCRVLARSRSPRDGALLQHRCTTP